MSIDFWTLGLQLINFLILVWLLQRFLYKPVRELIARRQKLASDASLQAQMLSKEAEATKAEYLEALAGIEQERKVLLDIAHVQLEDERKKAQAAAHGEADKIIAAAKTSIQEEHQKVLHESKDEIAGLVAKLAGQILRSLGPSVPSEAFLNRIEKEIHALPATDRRRLDDELSKNSAHLRVITARQLTRTEKKTWTDHLSKCLGHKVNIEFMMESDLIGGAELHFPHTVISVTWAEQLAQARGAIAGHENSK